MLHQGRFEEDPRPRLEAGTTSPTAGHPSSREPAREPDTADLLGSIVRDFLGLIAGQARSDGSGSAAGGSPEEAAEPARSRLRIGRYEVFEPLGSGGFGLVYRAFDPILKQARALKVPLPEVLASPARQARFLTDGEALARLDHRSIVRVYDADSYGGVCYIAMELCACGSLADWLKDLHGDVPIPLHWTADLLAQVASGVQHAHERGILHRDLKPGNILLARAADDLEPGGPRDGATAPLGRFCPKVADFGLAKLVGADAGREPTASGSLLGTQHYMAPEQVNAERDAVGPATDVYALGVILYELLTRRRPFEGPADGVLLDRIRREDPSPPRSLRRELPRDLEAVCLRCLEKRPRDRYQGPSELANELKRILGNLPTLTRPAPLWRRAARRVSRHPIGAAFLALVAAAAVVVNWSVDSVRRSQLDVLIGQVEAGEITRLPDLVPRLDPGEPYVVDRLARLFIAGKPVARLGAALILAKTDPDYGEYVSNWLLEAEPEGLRPIVGLLKTRLPGLVARLAACADDPTLPAEADREHADRRRAHAAAALILLDAGEGHWAPLRSSPDPQVRSFLIGLLGPAGVDPRRILDRLHDPATEASIRRALIQILEGIPAGAWTAELRAAALAHLLEVYRNDPDAGIHGSAKWLLHRWGQAAALEPIDRELAGIVRTEPPFQWRISREGLTLVTVDHPALDRVIEVSDSEITLAMYRRFNPKVDYSPEISPVASCPVNGVSYDDSAAFCNWLGQCEGIRREEACYDITTGGPDGMDPVSCRVVPGHRDRGGFRLPTGQEFDASCAAGTKTRRYFGDSNLLLDRYAWNLLNAVGQAHPVAGLIPNDLGLFDTLGNLQEWCERTDRPVSEGPVRADLRGGWCGYVPPGEVDRSVATEQPVKRDFRHPSQGLRVVRTKWIRQGLGTRGLAHAAQPQ